jgi:hypothetical protein
MIGRIEFDWREGPLQATLEDDLTWTCSDNLVQNKLNILAPGAVGYLPVGGQLRDGAALQSGRIITETDEPFDPDVQY